ncbi:calcium-binding protein [Aestuariicoccus sp. MJ-SS9]|uniref:calcium-binding protein n=1 Tax=Aestuariicoccus sp. MJ-SS9 TaxID=3079855 RepID=UPI002909321C|nr:calcium-binding protein [Aestuariicoccus sp. MJ-SS9]MDU8911675.1 calcium-binding protein [Aestuariicoccus sp. MJ-SS9]
MENLLQDVDEKLTFEQYAVSDNWVGEVDENGDPVLATSVETVLDVPYELEFNLAANLSADVQSVTIEVYFDGALVGTLSHDGAVFETYTLGLTGTGDLAELEFRITDVTLTSDSTIDTTGVIPSYSTTMTFLGNEVTVDAFAPGQNFIYQVLNGQLVKFDLETNSYTETETSAAVNVNAIGYSAEDDLIYGIARSDGVDAVGQTIARNDVIAIDATGATYAVSPGVMGSYIGDIDDQGNLWTFNGALTTAVVYDLSETNPDGTLVSQTVSMPSLGIPTSGLADLAYHAETQTFFGVAHGGATGLPGTLVAIDVSEVALGGEPIVTTQTIAGVIVDGVTKDGIPAGAFGATIVDGDGKVYIGANNTDHDLDPDTAKSGGFYRITTGTDGALYMELLADAPRVSSNDGAMDTRGVDPFLGIDGSSAVLLRMPELSVAIAEDDAVQLAARGSAVTVDLLANDSVNNGETLTLTHLNGIEVAPGAEITLSNGERVSYLGNGLLSLTPGSLTSDVTETLTYTIRNTSGVTDTATLTIGSSPVQGGAGNDHMVGFTDADGTQIDGADGANDVILGYGGNDKIYAGLGNDEIFGGAGADFMRGQAGDDVIHGGADNDVLDGGSGADAMFGGTGNDIYFVDDAGDVVSEADGGGTDTVKSRIGLTLGEGLENLWLAKGSEAVEGTGNALNNMIVGNEGDNRLDGAAGNDKLIAADGDDSVTGGDGHDTLHGDGGADTLFGDTGNDKLHGGAGGDIVHGGDGNDTLCPGDDDDVMYGGAGSDLLSGNAGADTAYGGLGDDIYKLSDALDTIVEYAGEGHDAVHAWVDVALSEHVEDLVFFGTANLSGVGNAGANRLTGNAGGNQIFGAGGDDTITGAGGDDALSGETGADKLLGGMGNDTLQGGAGADTLGGSDGADVLIGGTGDDFLSGDAGTDVFVFQAGDGADLIKGFDVAEDTLQLVGLSVSEVRWAEDSRGLRLDMGSGDTILLSGVSADLIQNVDLWFV